jgi:phosphate transport system substrate-binding protein
MFDRSLFNRRTLLLGMASLFTVVSVGQLQTVAAPRPSELVAQGKVTLSGAGASFPAPLYTKWFSQYAKANPNVQVSYQSVGSGAGVNQFIAGTVDFGASDTAMTDAEMAKVSKGVLLLPVTAGSVAVAFNVPGVTKLNLSRPALVGIFQGKIKSWNDPAIAKNNPGVKLPNLPITVVRRSDGSGTTAVFTGHLSAISPEWKAKPGAGKSIEWPVGVGGKGNEGVAALVQQTKGSVGYMESFFATSNKIPIAALQNKAGKFVSPNLKTGAAALAEVNLGANLRGFDFDPQGASAYPIVSFTWIMAYKKYGNPADAKAMRDVLNWAVTTGQTMADDLGYIPLPGPVVNRVKSAIQAIK